MRDIGTARRITRAARSWIAAAVLLGLGVGIGAPAAAQEDPDRDQWVGRYERLKADVEDLRVRVDTLAEDYKKAKRRNYPRGQELEKLRVALDEAKVDLAAREEEWANFEDEARRAGAPPGWFRED